MKLSLFSARDGNGPWPADLIDLPVNAIAFDHAELKVVFTVDGEQVEKTIPSHQFLQATVYE